MGDSPHSPQVQNLPQLLKAPNLVGGVQSAAVLGQELLVPLRGQHAQDFRRIITR